MGYVEVVRLGAAGSVLGYFERLDERRRAGRSLGRRHGSGSDGVKVPEYLDWFIWRLVISGKATKEELETQYTILDMLDLHDALDLDREATEKAMKKPKPEETTVTRRAG